MSNEQSDPHNQSTQSHREKVPPNDGTLTHPGTPNSAPATINWTPQADDSISGYQILEKLGRGGMGVVHLAKDLHADRLVALKRIVGDSIREMDLIRFRTEAQAIARLKHTQIIQIYDVSEHEGKPYFTMEYCPGGSLEKFLDRKPQSSLLGAQIAEVIARAIHHAHENGIVHRDLKPTNILIGSRLIASGDGSNPESSKETSGNSNQVARPFTPDLLRITDFGLAKKLESDTNLTQTQSIMGTPSYMAPEQATSSKQAGLGADIWAIGVMLYEMITGSLPFVGANAVEIIDNLRKKDPIPPSERVQVPKDLETICLKCLRKDPKDRYVSAQALADDLKAFQEGRTISARPISRMEQAIRWMGRNPTQTVLLAIAILSLMLGTIISLIYAKAESERSRELRIALKDADDAKREEGKRAEELKESGDKLAIALEDAGHFNANANILLAASAPTTELAYEFLSQVPLKKRKWDWHYLDKHRQGGLFPIYGHSVGVYCVDWSRDGTQIVSCGWDHMIRIWDARTGLAKQTLHGHTQPVNCVRFSPDGTQVVSGSQDHTIRIWDVKTGQTKRELQGHSERIHSVDWSPDGTQIVSGSQDHTVRIWDVQTGQTKRIFNKHFNSVTCVNWSPDGSRIASGSRDSTIRILDLNTGHSKRLLKGELLTPVSSLNWSPDGTQIVGGDTKSLRIWDITTGQTYPLLQARTSGVLSVSWSPDGSQIVSGGLDKTLQIWDAKTGQNKLTLPGHTLGVSSVKWSPDGSRIVSGSLDATLRIWDLKSPRNNLRFKGVRFLGSSCWNPEGNQIVSSHWDHTVRIWDARTGQRKLELQGHPRAIWNVSWSPDGSRIAGSGADKTLQIWDAKTGKSLGEFKGHTSWITCIHWSPDGSQMVSGSEDTTLRIWDAKTGETKGQLLGHSERVSCVCWSPDGSQIASCSADRTIRIWDARSGKSKHVLPGAPSSIDSICWSPDGNRIVSSLGKAVTVWDANTGKILSELLGHSDSINSVIWSPDGSRIASGSSDKTIRIWDVKTGQTLLELKGSSTKIQSLAWSPDGTQILSNDSDKSLEIWDAKTGANKMELPVPFSEISRVGFKTNGEFVTEFRDGKETIWDLKTGQPVSNGNLSKSTPFARNDPNGKHVVIFFGKRFSIVDLEIPEDEILRRQWLMRLDPDWHQAQMQQAEKDENAFAVTHHRYWYHQAKAEDAFLYSRYDEAFAHQLVAAILKPQKPEWPDTSRKDKQEKSKK